MMFDKVGFIGLGLIGGSLAKAIRQKNLAKTIVAYNRDAKVLSMAQGDGTIDILAYQIDESFKDCDLIFLCCPVSVNIQVYKQLASFVNPDCIITDVGSTKNDIMQAVSETKADVTFIGGHPMAGSEKTRYDASVPYLFENAYYILTPFEHTDPSKTDKLYLLCQTIGALPIIMDPKEHDLVTAAISHTPHIIAASLVNMIRDLDTPKNHMHTLAAGGFKDITRIASSSPTMWQQICLANPDFIIKTLNHYIEDLEKVRDMILSSDGDAIYNFFDSARLYRDSFQERIPGFIPKVYAITIDVVDEPGIIAKIATLLSDNGLNIKNIGIINNREETGGVLEIIFNDEKTLKKSVQLLQSYKYTVYTR